MRARGNARSAVMTSVRRHCCSVSAAEEHAESESHLIDSFATSLESGVENRFGEPRGIDGAGLETGPVEHARP